jgi:hypothetical protein
MKVDNQSGEPRNTMMGVAKMGKLMIEAKMTSDCDCAIPE